MSAVPARRFATAGTLALALALASPAAAFAAPSEEDRGAGTSREQQERADSKKGAGNGGSARSNGEAAAESKGSNGEAAKGSAGKASEGKGSQGKGSQGKGSQGKAEGSTGKSGEGRAAGGDPRGNNGTVKIDGEAFDDGRGNEPHVGCVFQVDFYGFDAGDTATITLTGHAPTGGGLLHSESGTVISDDAAGGGQDRDATLTYSVADQLSELLAITPHAQQGWHVKLAVDVDSAPGGEKQKVFWIDCPPAAPAPTTEPAAAEGAADTTFVAAGFPVETLGAGETSVVAHGAAVAGTTLAAAARTQSPARGLGETTVSSGSRLPSALAFTGVKGLAALLALGLSAVGVGALAHRLGRTSAALAAGDESL